MIIYYWFNKPSETVVLCRECAHERSDDPKEEFEWETTHPEDPFHCTDCATDVSH